MCWEVKSAQSIRDMHKYEENQKESSGFSGRKWNVLWHKTWCHPFFLPMVRTLERRDHGFWPGQPEWWTRGTKQGLGRLCLLREELAWLGEYYYSCFYFMLFCLLIFIRIKKCYPTFQNSIVQRYIQQKVSFHACPSASSQESMSPVCFLTFQSYFMHGQAYLFGYLSMPIYKYIYTETFPLIKKLPRSYLCLHIVPLSVYALVYLTSSLSMNI